MHENSNYIGMKKKKSRGGGGKESESAPRPRFEVRTRHDICTPAGATSDRRARESRGGRWKLNVKNRHCPRVLTGERCAIRLDPHSSSVGIGSERHTSRTSLRAVCKIAVQRLIRQLVRKHLTRRYDYDFGQTKWSKSSWEFFFFLHDDHCTKCFFFCV